MGLLRLRAGRGRCALDDERLHVMGHSGRVDDMAVVLRRGEDVARAKLIAPQTLARSRIQHRNLAAHAHDRQRFAVRGDFGRGVVDGLADGGTPAEVAVRRIQAVDVAVLAQPAHIDIQARDNWGRVAEGVSAFGSAGRPVVLAGGRVDRVQHAVVGADIDAVVRYRGRGDGGREVEGERAVPALRAAHRRLPLRGASLRVQGVEGVIPATEIEGAAVGGGLRLEEASGRLLPLELPGSRVQAEDLAVAAYA